MVLTPTEGRNALVHLLDNLFDLEPDSTLSKALEECGFCDIECVINMTLDAIERLYYTNEAENKIPLKLGEMSPLKHLKVYDAHRSRSGKAIGDDWMGVTSADYRGFLNSETWYHLSISRAPIPTRTSSSSGKLLDPNSSIVNPTATSS